METMTDLEIKLILITPSFPTKILGRQVREGKALADPGEGAPGLRPPNGRGPMFFYAQQAYFSQICPCWLRSRLILSIILIEIWPKTRKK